MAGKYHVKIDGQGYLIVPRSYRRVAEGPAPWRWWWGGDWRGGDGHATLGTPQAPGGGGNRYRVGYGVDVVGGYLKMSVSTSTKGGLAGVAGENGFAAMAGMGTTVYAAASSSGKVYRLVAGSDLWELEVDTGKAALRCMAVHEGKLYVGSGSDGTVKVFDGAAWADAFVVGGAAGVAALCSYSVWDSGTSRTVPRLFAAVEYASGQAKVFSWDGAAATEVQGVREPSVGAVAVYEGRLCVATKEGDLYAGRLLAYDGSRAGSGEWSEAAVLADDYLVSLCAFDGLLFAGSGYGRRVYAWDGERLVQAYDFVAAGQNSPGALSAMAVQGGVLVVGYNHGVDGAALLSKLPAGLIQEDGVRVVAGGARPEVEKAARGWWMGTGTGAAGNVRAAGVSRGVLYFSRDAAAAAQVHIRGATPFRLAGQLELSQWQGDGAGPWALRRVVVEHDALAATYSVAVYAALDGGAYALVGTSNAVGATSAAFEFAVGTKVRRLGLRLDLVAGSNAGGPVVRRVGVEFAPVEEVKRRWTFEVRCEGAASVPLRLLDNTLEAKTGAELSASLWASRVARGVTFEDLDGVSRDAWFVELVERTGELDQKVGAQTVAACELVEG